MRGKTDGELGLGPALQGVQPAVPAHGSHHPPGQLLQRLGLQEQLLSLMLLLFLCDLSYYKILGRGLRPRLLCRVAVILALLP